MHKISRLATTAPFWILFFLFLTPLLLLKQSFIYGDYAQQHVPWGIETWKAIRSGSLPFWTHAMACGFPLFAEAQCGALYWATWLGYKFLPFWTAYTLSIPLHFLIGGHGMFFYARKIRLSDQAAAIAATVFCFSSNYAGCFMNTASLRVLSWLPAALLAMESISAGNRSRTQMRGFVALSLIVCQQWFAGSPQMAFYSMGYLLIYQLATKGRQRFYYFCAAVLSGTLMAWPQLGPALELIIHSTRHAASAGFALTGSAPPIAPLSLLYPEWGNMLRYTFYIGILPFFLVCVFLSVRNRSIGRKHVWIALLFLVLALGKYNPLYRWVVSALSLTAFRLPAKLLFFSAFSLTVVAAFGWDALSDILKNDRQKRRFVVFAFGLAVTVSALPLLAQLVLSAISDGMPALREWYIEKLMAEKGPDAKPVSYYETVLGQFILLLKSIFSYRHALNWHAILLVWAGAIGSWILSRRSKPGRWAYAVFCFLLVADLGVYGYTMSTGFIGNAREMSFRQPSEAQQKTFDFLKRNPGRFAELVQNPAREHWVPNAAMADGLDQLGGYSPLLIHNYYAWAHPLGAADGSLGRLVMRDEAWEKRRRLWDLAGVRYLLTDHALKWPDLELRESFEGHFIYENKNVNRLLETRRNSLDRSLAFDLDLPKRELVQLPLMSYPGWSLRVDGKPEPWFPGEGGFVAFFVNEGPHRIILEYVPSGFPGAWIASFIAIAMVIFLAYNMARSKES